jgi:hypothetical protein
LTPASTMSKTPSTILSDALASFNRAATLAFNAAQDQARKDVTQATTDARDARRERDDAVNDLQSYRLEEQAWKAAADHAELTINHHLETIAQLRQEAVQWKNQCLRLEETSRQEATSWKEQFLRVEQERSKLAQRVEELVAEQLGSAQTSVTPYTPVVRYSAMGNLSTSTRFQRVPAPDTLTPRLQEYPPSTSGHSVSKTTSNANRTRPGPILQLPTPSSENQRSARQRVIQETAPPVTQPGLTSNGTRQVLIRRVQAVVEIPVKEESVDLEGVGPDKHISTSASNIASSSASTSASKTPRVLPRTTESSKATPRIKRKASAKRTYVEIDEESEQDNAAHDSEQSDAEQYQPASDGDDDDELLMGIETNRKEVYGMKRVPKPISVQKTTRTPIAVKKRKVPPPTKKSRPSTASRP